MKKIFLSITLLFYSVVLFAQAPYFVKDIYIGTGFNHSSDPTYFTNLNGNIYFTADSGTGPKLWKSDGSDAGTVWVSDIAASYMSNVGGKLYFISSQTSSGREIWTSDGTTGGTQILKDINPGSASSADVHNVTDVNGTIFFSADDGTNGKELWKSDGTTNGTVLVKDILSGPTGSTPVYLTNVNGILFFLASDSTNGYELWKSDGTAAGTVMVKDINPGIAHSYASNLYAMNGKVYFAAFDGVHGMELWKSDGTAAGTVLVKDIYSVVSAGGSDPKYFTEMGGIMYFSADDGLNGTELWKSDGTASGTVLVKDIRAGGGYNSNPSTFTSVNGMLYFACYNPQAGFEVWKTDGTASGTVFVADPSNGSTMAQLDYFTNVNGVLYFGAGLASNTLRLYTTDGTTGGTVKVDSFLCPRSNLIESNGIFYMSGNDGQRGVELWALQPAAQAIPAAPTALNASPTLKTDMYGKIMLQWTDNANNENGFHIERSPTGTGSWTIVDSVAANVISYLDTNLLVSTQYYYRVNAYNATGNSAYSNTANSTTYSGIENVSAANDGAWVFPNPFNDKLHISLSTVAKTKVLITLSDINGRTIKQETYTALRGNNDFIYLTGDKLESGIYLLTLTSDAGIRTMKLIKE